MEIILLRHGRAEDRLAFAKSGQEDRLRPLTPAGTKRLRRALPGLRGVVPAIDLLVTSPLLRARQTAEVLLEGYPVPLQELPALAPGGERREVNRWLARQRAGVVLLVGHEPDLGSLASWYLTGSGESFMPLKKGALCLIRFNGQPAAAQGSLQLLLTSSQLRQLAK